MTPVSDAKSDDRPAPETTIYEDGSYLAHNPSWHVEHSAWKAANIEKMIAKLPVPPRTICEIGCGAGEILATIKRKHPDIRVVGYDISPDVKALVEQRPEVEFHAADLLQQSEKFDLILCIDVFEHVEDYFGFLRRLRERAPYHIFHIPLDLSAQTVARGSPIASVRENLGHLHYFTKETALASLRETGFEIVDWFYTQGSVELPDRGAKAKLLKWPRKLMYSLAPDLTVRVLGGYSMMVLAKH